MAPVQQQYTESETEAMYYNAGYNDAFQGKYLDTSVNQTPAYLAGFNAGQAAMGGAGAEMTTRAMYAGAFGGVASYPPAPANAVVHTTGCATATCVNTGCATAEEATMSLVGAGNGDYITETTYRYVGQGQGNLTVVTTKGFYWGRILALVALVTGGAVAAVMLTKPEEPKIQQAANNQMPAPVMDKVCTYWGDPHLKTFDGARPSFYGDGEYYIVKSHDVTIQGRYMGTKYTAGLAATNKIAVGGAFMKGHKLVIGALEDGPIKIDGIDVLTAFPSRREIENVGEVTYTGEGDLVDQATAQWAKKVVKLHVPGVITLEVFRWSNYLDLRITMPDNQESIDGGCGNMNNDPNDDTTEAIFNRIGARVPQGENLFNYRTHEELSEVEEKLLTMCDPEKLGTAQKECNTDMASWEATPATSETKSCMLDICYGSNEHTLRMAKSLGLVPADSAAMQTH